MNIWLEGIRNKVRFVHRGIISVEDLFDLDMADLDAIYQKLSKELRDLDGDSLLDEKQSKEVDLAKLKIEIVKNVFDIKKAEAAELQREIKNLEEKQKIMRIINEKEDAKLADLSIDELKNKLDEL